MPRSIWKGAISFGLVHIPVALVSATSQEGVDFDWLDKRSMDPVGYKRINKTTGKEVSKENIVKGVEYEKGRYVVLSEDEIKAAHPKATQTIDIFSFVDRAQIPLQNIDTPYYLAPDKRGEKVYALLRKTLADTDKVALANVIIRTKQHLAAVMALDCAIVLVLLRWPAEVRDLDSLELPESATTPSLSKGELSMARKLVEDMSGDWQPDEYRDTFQEQIMKLVETKARDGKLETVDDEPQERKSADVIDLTELLKRSLGGRKPASPKSDAKKTKAPAGKTSSKPAKKSSSATSRKSSKAS